MELFKRKYDRESKKVHPLHLLFNSWIIENEKCFLLNIDSLKRQIGKSKTIRELSKKHNYPILVRNRTTSMLYDNSILVDSPHRLRSVQLDTVLLEEGFTIDEINEWILPYVNKIEFGFFKNNKWDNLMHDYFEHSYK